MLLLLSLTIGWREAFRELMAALADAWLCADVPGHLAAWREVSTGTVKVD